MIQTSPNFARILKVASTELFEDLEAWVQTLVGDEDGPLGLTYITAWGSKTNCAVLEGDDDWGILVSTVQANYQKANPNQWHAHISHSLEKQAETKAGKGKLAKTSSNSTKVSEICYLGRKFGLSTGAGWGFRGATQNWPLWPDFEAMDVQWEKLCWSALLSWERWGWYRRGTYCTFQPSYVRMGWQMCKFFPTYWQVHPYLTWTRKPGMPLHMSYHMHCCGTSCRNRVLVVVPSRCLIFMWVGWPPNLGGQVDPTQHLLQRQYKLTHTWNTSQQCPRALYGQASMDPCLQCLSCHTHSPLLSKSSLAFLSRASLAPPHQMGQG